MKKNVILTDFDIPQGWAFPAILAQATGEPWEAVGKVCNQPRTSAGIRVMRYVTYFMFPLKMVMRRKKLGSVIGWQQFFGLNFAFYQRLFGLKKVNDLTVMTFIYKRKGGLAGSIYHRYMRYIVTSRYVDRLICFSQEERDSYERLFGVEGKFLYTPLGDGNIPTKAQEEEALGDDGYIFAPGRSNRNYDFLVELMAGMKYPLVVACDTYHRSSASDGVTVLNNCFGSDYQSRLNRCHCVAIPLDDLHVSAGQLSIIQALRAGKPVICTLSDGAKDYVAQGDTGLLLPNDPRLWQDAISGIFENKKLYNDMCKKALKTYRELYTDDAMFARLARIIKDNS